MRRLDALGATACVVVESRRAQRREDVAHSRAVARSRALDRQRVRRAEEAGRARPRAHRRVGASVADVPVQARLRSREVARHRHVGGRARSAPGASKGARVGRVRGANLPNMGRAHHVLSGHSRGRRSSAAPKGSAVAVPGGQKWPAGHSRSGNARPAWAHTWPASRWRPPIGTSCRDWPRWNWPVRWIDCIPVWWAVSSDSRSGIGSPRSALGSV